MLTLKRVGGVYIAAGKEFKTFHDALVYLVLVERRCCK